ncbi:MAG: hypothetical protein AAGI91_08095 [Bacteroidota bacterium]
MRFLPVVLFVAVLLLAAAPAPPAPASAAAADTLQLSVRSGEPLVTALPGTSASTYRVLRAPALSWLVGRSFYWRTLPAERGREFVLVEQRLGGEPQDTLVLVIDVAPG